MDTSILHTQETQLRKRHGEQIESLTLPEVFNSLASFSNSIASSIALRFGGFTASLEAMIDPLTRPMPHRLVADFFSQKLGELTALAEKNPVAAHRIISTHMQNSPRLLRELVLVACGDGSALARALDAIENPGFDMDAGFLAPLTIIVAKLRPLEGRHLIRQAFLREDLEGQLKFLKLLVEDDKAGGTALIGEMFVKMMESATQSERIDIVYPTLFQIISGCFGQKPPRAGLLAALLHGWLCEGCNGGEDAFNIERLKKIMV